MQLCRQREAVARMAGNKCFLHGVFALECAVHPRRVKIREAALDERIHHFLDLLNVDLARVVRVQRRQTHEAEAEFLSRHFTHTPYVKNSKHFASYILQLKVYSKSSFFVKLFFRLEIFLPQ